MDIHIKLLLVQLAATGCLVNGLECPVGISMGATGQYATIQNQTRSSKLLDLPLDPTASRVQCKVVPGKETTCGIVSIPGKTRTSYVALLDCVTTENIDVSSNRCESMEVSDLSNIEFQNVQKLLGTDLRSLVASSTDVTRCFNYTVRSSQVVDPDQPNAIILFTLAFVAMIVIALVVIIKGNMSGFSERKCSDAETV